MGKETKLAKTLLGIYDSLSEEQKAKAKACASIEEIVQLAAAENIELPNEVLDAISGGSIFLTDLQTEGYTWDVLSDADGSVLAGGIVGKENAQKKARELGQSDGQIDWNQVLNLRRDASEGPAVPIKSSSC